MPYWNTHTFAFPERITALEFPHNTMGSICFLKNGPGWVINIGDNSATSQETCFGHIVKGWEQILRLNHFENNVDLHVSTAFVSDIKIQVLDASGAFHIDWVEPVEPARRQVYHTNYNLAFFVGLLLRAAHEELMIGSKGKDLYILTFQNVLSFLSFLRSTVFSCKIFYFLLTDHLLQLSICVTGTLEPPHAFSC
mmetsp:Transcript_20122/g.29872  ORF Transcript_20122/g.29872 Transcript_20122/m.29872 type:complete len:195 (+) Transcript_20122:1300-1884(+)